jgi:NMD protein affecting ribosome stability and mRNA decay
MDEPSETLPVGGMTPLDYLLQCLEGKFDKETVQKEGVVRHTFKRNGKTIIIVLIANTGKMKIVSVKGEKMFDWLKSIEEAEQAMRELLP